MPTYQVAFRASTFTVVVQDEGEALPQGFTNIGTFEHHTTDDALGHSHTIYHHVRDALYKANVTAMQMVNIYTDGMTIPEAPVDPDPGGGGPIDPLGGILSAVNVKPAAYWDPNGIFLDAMKSSGGDWFQYDEDLGQNVPFSYDWIEDLPAGESVSTWVILDQNPQFGLFPTGDYIARTSNTNATLDIDTPTGITNKVQTPGQVTFTVADGVNPSTISFRIHVRNETGAPIDVGDLYICRVQDQARLLAGELFHEQWLEDLENTSIIRCLDWSNTNFTTVTEPSDLMTEDSRVWVHAGGGHVPYSVCAKAAAQLDCDLWVTLPSGQDDVTITSLNGTTNTLTARSIPAGKWVNGSRVYFYADHNTLPPELSYGVGYFVIGLAGNTFQLALTSGGAPINFTYDAATEIYISMSRLVDHTALYDAIAAQIAGVPEFTGQIYVEWSNEVWNTGFNAYQFARNVMGPAYAGGQREQGLGMAAGALLSWEAFERALPRNRIIRTACGQFAWFDILRPFFEFTAGSQFDNEGEAMVDLLDIWGIAPYIGHTPVSELATRGAASWNPAQWQAYMNGEVDEVADIVAQHISELRAFHPTVPVTTYECGQHIAATGTISPAMRAVQVSYHAYLRDQRSADNYSYYLNQVFVPNELIHFNHYTVSGGWATTGDFIFQWGLKPNHSNDHVSPRFDWWKQLPKYL